MNYKVTKIGLLNFWYFDEEEFNFSDGKIILRGENGSGKSVTMQSFIPLILDGNKLPSRLDPFGSKEKRIEDYLLGPSDGIQKEESTGYLYMETYNDSLKKYITIGIGLRAKKGQGTDFWGFALKDGKRIGEDFILYKDFGQKRLLTKKELKAKLESTNEFAETQKDYKRIVNNLLFGFKDIDAYDEFINVLLQLRSPKLSKEYTPTKLMNILSSVLQPLTDDDIRPVSIAIEDTNKTKERIETLENQSKSLNNLLRTYQNYNEIILYNKANHVSELRKKIKNKKNELENTKTELSKKQQEQATIEEKIATLSKEFIENQSKLNTIDNKDLLKYTSEHEKVKTKLNEIGNKINDIKDKLEDKLNKEKDIENEITNSDNKIYSKEKELMDITNDIEEMSEEVKLTDIGFAISNVKEINFEYIEDRITKYKNKLNKIKIKLEEKQNLEIELNNKEEEEQKVRKIIDAQTSDLKILNNNKQKELDDLKDQINLVDKENKYIKIDNDSKLKIYNYINLYSYENYLKSKDVYLKIAKYYEIKAIEEKNNIQNKISNEKQQLNILNEELEILKNNKELQLEEDEEVLSKLEELNIPYTTLYKAIEFKDNIKEDAKNKIEELLLSLNILNAKIVPKKYLNTLNKINSIFLKPGVKKTHNLLEYFKVLDSSVSKQDVIEILESISIDEQNSTYINSNNAQLDFLIGYPSDKYKNKYIGIIKRIEEQQNLISLKEKEIENKEKIILNYQNILNNTIEKIDTIQKETNNFPDNKELEQINNKINNLEIEHNSNINRDKEILEKITLISKKIELMMIEIKNLKENILIPLNLSSYKETLSTLDVLQKNIYILKTTNKELETLIEEKQSKENSLEDTIAIINDITENLQNKNKELVELQSQKQAIDDILANPDYQKLAEQLNYLQQRQNIIPQTKDKLILEKGQISELLRNLVNKVTLLESELNNQKLELELRSLILEKEYNLGYVYKEDILNIDKILNDLDNRKDSDISRAIINLTQSYNDYRLDLQDYHLRFSEIFNSNDKLKNTFIEKGLDEKTTDSIIISSNRENIESIYQGKEINIYELNEHLKDEIAESQNYISEQERRLFEEILLKTVGGKIRDRIESSKKWVSKMNEIIEKTQIDSNLSFQLEWASKKSFTEEELDTKELVRLFKIDAGQLNKQDSEKLITHFRSQIKREIEYSEKTHESYTSIISKVLDYRNWFEFKLYYKRKSGEKKELTNKVFFVFSGGERAKSMYVPLFAAIYAKLLSADQSALRLIALDEAFAGVDNKNISEMFDILSQLNLDYILTSQSLWGDYDTIKSLAICELLKDEEQKAVAVRNYYWNGQKIKILETSV